MQVGSYKGNISIFRRENIIIGIGEHGKQVNLGADDKNGIWIALELLRTEPILKVVLYTFVLLLKSLQNKKKGAA